MAIGGRCCERDSCLKRCLDCRTLESLVPLLPPKYLNYHFYRCVDRVRGQVSRRARRHLIAVVDFKPWDSTLGDLE